MSDADLCKCGHMEFKHVTDDDGTICIWRSCPCTAFTPAQPATEDEPPCTCGESTPTVTTPGPCYWAENAPGVESQVHCPVPPASEVPDLAAGIERVLGEEIVRQGIVAHPTTPEQAKEGIHSWRCGYPDTYGNGPCDCFDEMVSDLAAAVIAYLHRKDDQ